MTIPRGLAESCRGSAERTLWLARLPTLVSELARRWSLTLGPTFDGREGSCAWVARVILASGEGSVLKVGLPHMEAAQEIAGLRFWDGNATVRLLDADDTLNAMLLELCVPGTPLRNLSEPEQDSVIATLLVKLWRSPPVESPFRPLSAMLEHWTNETLADEERWPDRALVQAGLDLFRELPYTAKEHVLLFTDLHAGNILRAGRAPWLAIDPKPFAGDPAYDATQHLFNCVGRMRADPGATIANFANTIGISRARLRLWTFARAAAQPRSQWGNDVWIDIAKKVAP